MVPAARTWPCAGSPAQDIELTKGFRAAVASEDKRFMARYSRQGLLVSGPPLPETRQTNNLWSMALRSMMLRAHAM